MAKVCSKAINFATAESIHQLLALRPHHITQPNLFQTERTRLAHLPSFCELVFKDLSPQVKGLSCLLLEQVVILKIRAADCFQELPEQR